MTDEKFDLKFWTETLRKNKFPVKEKVVEIDRKMLPGVQVKESYLLFDNGLINIYFIQTENIKKATFVRASRHFTRQRPLKNMMIFSDGSDSLLVMFPKGYDGEAKILHLEGGILYPTDKEALSSLEYSDDLPTLNKKFEEEFLPYERVRDEFFTGYRDRFQKVVRILLSKGFDAKRANQYAQRLLGRLMFFYFLQRKGWLKGNRRYIDTIESYKRLNEVFYNGLNKENNEFGLPFINGSLFEREDYLTKDIENTLDEEMTPFFIETRKFLNSYNFTVDESAPLEREVGIDPYLLGTVFENMLPENERGGKGTFYTPISEISFICRRAIANYLGIPDRIEGEKFVDGISSYIDTLGQKKSEKDIREFIDKLLNITILDPAVGSGGFLLGMMQELVRIIHEAEEIVGWYSDPKKLKEKILSNLWGFDIETEAIEIARLRLWLSMILDEKEPEALPNLDVNLVDIADSLDTAAQLNFDEFEDRNTLEALRKNYLSQHNPMEKNQLRKEMKSLREKITKKARAPSETIEMYMLRKADIVVMNPPYVRQESIPPNKKKEYSTNFRMAPKSDIYIYFFIRAAGLLSERGVVSVISSDKWLETGYGLKLQDWIKNRLIAVYGQRNRSFGADVNSVITVYRGSPNSEGNAMFAYMESYSSDKVMRSVYIPRKELKPGKWFYLRAPKLFMEKIYPKLTHKLGDFAEIKFGIKTGANDFFYMKDISHLYEADYLTNPKKFQEWGVTAKNEKELKDHGLIYVENEGGERFVIDAKDVIPLVKSIREVKNYIKNEAHLLCLYTDKPGQFTEKYIRYGETKEVVINANNTKGKIVKVVGYQSLETTKSRKVWYRIADIKQTRIVLQHFFMDRLFSPVFKNSVAVDAALYYFIPKSGDFSSWGLYLNGTLFLMCRELYAWRMGGGVGQMMIKDYEELLVPDMEKMHFTDATNILDGSVKEYFKEIKMKDRRELDTYIFKRLGLNDIDMDVFYNEFVELVEDRLIKADRPLKRLEAEQESEEDEE
jgi:type II restriction/modification system DNA methylase subunit YeeA